MTALTGDQAEKLRRIGLFDAGWYCGRYGDVRQQSLAPFDHFCRLGVAIGRDPGPGFSGKDYLAANPDVAQAGLSPLVHFLDSGHAERRPLRPGSLPANVGQVLHLRRLLETGGLTDRPLAALRTLADDPATGPDAAALAQEVLAIWALRDPDTLHEASFRLKQRLDFTDTGGIARLSPLWMMAQLRAGHVENALATYRSAPWSPDLELAATWSDATDSMRTARVSRVFAHFGLTGVTLAGDAATAFDALSGGPEQPAADTDPVVTVLIAAHDAAATLSCALRSLRAQTLPAWEAIVIDDASRDHTADLAADWAARDPRIRVVRQPVNRGAYAARNAGLALARGRFVTLLDADDWAHPARLAQQVANMTSTPGLVGCMSLQARVNSSLCVTRWTGNGTLIHEDTSSLFLPRTVLSDLLGGWHDWRVSADSELLRRARRMFGAGAVTVLGNAFLGLQRDQPTNATADPASGMNWFYYGARHEAHESQGFHHARAPSLKRTAERAVPVPRLIGSCPDRKSEFSLNRVYCGLFSVPDNALSLLLGWLDEDAAAGRQVGLVPLWSSAAGLCRGPSVHPDVRARIDGQGLRVLVYGETVRCDTFCRLPDQHVDEAQRYLPHVSDPSGLVLWPGKVPDVARTRR